MKIKTKRSIVVTALGEISWEDIPVGPTIELERLQKLVGGYIELVSIPGRMQAYVNENGKYENLPVNALATVLLRRHSEGFRMAMDFVVGNMVIQGPEKVLLKTYDDLVSMKNEIDVILRRK